MTVCLDLSLSSVIFPFCLLLNWYGRSKCRKGVIEIETGQKGELFVVRYMAAILIASAKNILCLPIVPNNCSNEEYPDKMPCGWWQIRWQFRLRENGSRLFGAICANKRSGITCVKARIALFEFRSPLGICGNMPVEPSILLGIPLWVNLHAETPGCWAAIVLRTSSS